MLKTDEIAAIWRRSPVACVPPAELILITDFDGTLADIVPDPAQAAARKDSLAALRTLSELIADVIVLSSRTTDQLQRLVRVPGVRLIGDSGLATPRLALRQALDRFNEEASEILKEVPGAWLEVKPASSAVHFRNAALSANEMLERLNPLINGRLSASLGKRVIEVHARRAGKGSALAALLPAEDPGGVVCFGDDENDRSMFEYVASLDIPHLCVGVGSPEAPSNLFEKCDLVVESPAAAAALMEEIAAWAAAQRLGAD